ncbi:hypothetical protein HFD88_004957 [Aspergillus terreus]|nr:hypothetical protein HFD88_004957 [Aspergillus terreus]
MSSSLQVDVYCAPVIPAKTGDEDPSKQLWSPICCTLIQGPTSAVLVDTPTTTDLTVGLSQWVKKTAPGKKLQYIYTTHAHGDHFFGNPIIARDFPGVKCVATAFVVNGIKDALSPEKLAVWKRMFPGQIPDGQFIPDTLPTHGRVFIDGHELVGIDVAFSDTQHSSFLHVPSLKLVVAGDIVYGDCFQHCGEANTPERRRHWLQALDQIAARKPNIVVPGHKRVSQVDGAYLIDQTREYLLAFEEQVQRGQDSDQVERAMKERYPHRWNDFILSYSCKSSVEYKLSAKGSSI